MDDLISRQALKQALGINSDDCYKCAWGYHGRCKRVSDFEDACWAIDDAPSAERWIPCSERLPEEGEKVLASTKNTIFTQVFKGVQGTSDSWWWNNNTIKTIYAWMPLPEPYVERRADGTN